MPWLVAVDSYATNLALLAFLADSVSCH